MTLTRGPALLFAFMALVLIMALYGTLTNAWTRTHAPVPAGAATTPPDFGLLEGESYPASPTDSRFEGGVFVTLPPYTWFGTFVGGDGYTGEAKSTTFPIQSTVLAIPLLGYPNSPDTRLDIEILDVNGTPTQQITYKGDNPGERIGYWFLSTKEWKGLSARLHLIDNSSASRGWLGIAYPLEREHMGIAWLDNLPRNYGWYTLQVLTVISLLFLPGLALKTWLRRWNLHPALLPLPGLILLAITGLGIWTGAIPLQPLHIGYVWLIVSICGASVLMWVNLRPRLSFTRQDRQVLFVYFAICVGALSFGVLPLEVAEEHWIRTPLHGRMIASPPDHFIPHATAVFMDHARDSNAPKAHKFDDVWTLGSRGPLVPFVILASFAIFDTHPPLHASPELSRWPLDTTAIALSRSVGILTNALVILGVAFFIGGLSSKNEKRTLVWSAIAPVTLINVDYLWPKLFATFFLFLALGAVARRKPMWLCALPCVAAYLSHPIGALFTPPILLYLGLLKASPLAVSKQWIISMITTGLKFSALWFCFALPWMIFKWQLDQPDVFTRYPLGDGNGLESAASLSSWMTARLHNVWYSFVPSAFFFSDLMKEWFGTPLSDSLRWGIGYAKSMPGNIGIVTYLAGVALFFRTSSALPYYRSALLFTSALLILIFWGFSGDGLGRNCLEPLSILFLLWISQRVNPEGRIWDALVAITAFEALSVRLIGILGQPTFSLQTITIEPAFLLTLSTTATLAPLLLLMKQPPPCLACK